MKKKSSIITLRDCQTLGASSSYHFVRSVRKRHWGVRFWGSVPAGTQPYFGIRKPVFSWASSLFDLIAHISFLDYYQEFSALFWYTSGIFATLTTASRPPPLPPHPHLSRTGITSSSLADSYASSPSFSRLVSIWNGFSRAVVLETISRTWSNHANPGEPVSTKTSGLALTLRSS